MSLDKEKNKKNEKTKNEKEEKIKPKNKSVLEKLGLPTKSVSFNRKIDYVLPELKNNQGKTIVGKEDWRKIGKVLFKNNVPELIEKGFLELDELLKNSKLKNVNNVYESAKKQEKPKPFCNRKIYIGQIRLEGDELLFRQDKTKAKGNDFKDREVIVGWETCSVEMLFYKNKQYYPDVFLESIKGKNDEEVNEYIDKNGYPQTQVTLSAKKGVFDSLLAVALAFKKNLPKDEQDQKYITIPMDEIVVVFVGGKPFCYKSKEDKPMKFYATVDDVWFFKT